MRYVWKIFHGDYGNRGRNYYKGKFSFGWESYILGMRGKNPSSTYTFFSLLIPASLCLLPLQVFPEAVDPGDVVAQLECEFLSFNS